MKRTLLALIIVILFILFFYIGAAYNYFIPETYRPFTLSTNENGQRCETYTASCKCYGSVFIQASYPPSYTCKGFNKCVEINEMVCS